LSDRGTVQAVSPDYLEDLVALVAQLVDGFAGGGHGGQVVLPLLEVEPQQVAHVFVAQQFAGLQRVELVEEHLPARRCASGWSASPAWLWLDRVCGCWLRRHGVNSSSSQVNRPYRGLQSPSPIIWPAVRAALMRWVKSRTAPSKAPSARKAHWVKTGLVRMTLALLMVTGTRCLNEPALYSVSRSRG